MDFEAEIRRNLEQITDFYLPAKDPLDGFLYPNAAPVRQFKFLYPVIELMIKSCIEKTAGGYDEFVVRVLDRSYRGHKISTIEGDFFTLRRMPLHVPSLTELGLDPAIRKVLMSPHLNRGGLIILCGETGQGKSTTCAATIKERMLTHGSFCLTVEDPPEMPLHGQHGEGRCLQTEFRSGSFADAMRGAMRCYPTVSGSIMYVGETRDPETAAEVLRIALNGNLVFTTLHAQDVPSGIKRLVSLAGAIMNPIEASDMLASVFRVGLHQTLESVRPPPGQPPRKKLNISFLLSSSPKTPVANKIRKQEADALGTDLHQQQTILKQHGADALLKQWEI